MQALENCWGVLRASFEFKLLYPLILLPSSNEVNKPKIFIQGQCKILFEPRIFNKRELDFQKNSAVISGAQLHFRRLLWRWYLHMHSKYVNSTNGRQYLKEHGFSDIDSIWRKKILAVRRCFSPILAIFHWPAQFRPYYYFRFKIWRHIWIQRIRFPIKTRSFRERDTIFGEVREDNVCACAVSTLILLQVANLSPEMDSATMISYGTQIFWL